VEIEMKTGKAQGGAANYFGKEVQDSISPN